MRSARDSYGTLPRETLADIKARGVEEVTERVEALCIEGGNTLVRGPMKAGKTTLLGNLFRSLITGKAFLSRFRVVPIEGAAGFLNMKLTEGQAADLFGALGIPDDRIALLNMEAHNWDLRDPYCREETIAWAGDMGVEASALDPFAGSYKGDENDNEEVGRFLDSLDEIKAQAGISDLLLSSHFGRSHEERSRGAAR